MQEQSRKDGQNGGEGTGNGREAIRNDFAMTPDDESRTMILFPIKEGETSIKLTVKTAKVLIAILDHQIQEWL